MKRIAFFALVISLAAAGSSSVFGGQQQTYSGLGSDAALASGPSNKAFGTQVIPADAHRSGPPTSPVFARTVAPAPKHRYRRVPRECPGYTKSRRARLHLNRTVERLLARGIDDPLSQPAARAAIRAEKAVAPAVDACNRAWLRHVSIYGRTAMHSPSPVLPRYGDAPVHRSRAPGFPAYRPGYGDPGR